MNDKDKADVSRMAAAVLGGDPAEQAAPPQAAPQAAPPAPKEQDTPQDKAAEEGSPKTEDDKSADNPVIYEIPMGDGTRRMTPEQISSALGRYATMNHRHAELSPILDAVGKIAQASGATTSEEVVSHLTALAEANQKSPTMGADQTPDDTTSDAKSKPQSAEEISAALSQWEEENAVSLPPGYKDAIVNQGQSQQQIMQQMQQMQGMMRQVLASAAGSADAARTAMGDSNAQRIEAIQRQIANNIDRAQQQLSLPDEKAQDFMIFAAERGYTMEDFANPGLTAKVMRDFKNDMDSPEMERLRQMAQRRQAFTGSVGSTPAAGPADAMPKTDTPLAQMTDAALARRTQS